MTKMKKQLKTKEEDFENERNRRLLDMIKNNELTLSGFREEYYSLEEKYKTLESLKKDLEREIEVLKIQTEEINKTQNSKYEHEITISGLKTEIELRELKIGQLNTQLNQDKKHSLEQIEDLKNKLNDSKSRIDELTSDVKELDKLRGKMNELHVYKTKAANYENLELLLELKNKEIEGNKQKLEEFTKKIEDLERNNRKLENKIEESTEKLKTMQEEIEQVKADNDRLNYQLEDRKNEDEIPDKMHVS